MTKAYIASPLFNEEQNAHITQIEHYCKDNHIGFFSPRGGEVSKHYALLTDQSSEFDIHISKNLIFTENIKEILDSDVVFVNPKGFDSGTFFELGFALSKGKQVICTQPEMQGEFSKLISKFKSKMYESMRGHDLPHTTIYCEGDSFYVKDNTGLTCTVIAEQDCEYHAVSKILIGFLYGLNVPVIDYIDVPRGSNLMLSSCVNVYELTDDSVKLKDIESVAQAGDKVKLKIGGKDQ